MWHLRVRPRMRDTRSVTLNQLYNFISFICKCGPIVGVDGSMILKWLKEIIY
jgi:hypothetical protein